MFNPSRKHKLIKWLKTLAISLLVLASMGLAIREILFSGAILVPQTLQPNDSIIDMHVHIAGIGAGNTDCYVAPALRNNMRFNQYLAGFGVSITEIQQKGDQIAVDKLAERLQSSNTVKGAVLLALDGVINQEGQIDYQKTEVYIPNDYVLKQVKRYPTLFYYGASINPYRTDAIERLIADKNEGAVLIKWIPNIQHIDPADPKLIPFYTKMRELNLMLLSHTGQERSFSSADDTLGDPQRLELPLSLGVTVIAGHVATTGLNHQQSNYARILPLMQKYPNLYADISSLTQINKLGYLQQALNEPRLKGRLIYGSDYPLSNMILTSAWNFPLNLTRAEMARINQIPNHWDRDVELKRNLGVPAEVFTLSAQLITNHR